MIEAATERVLPGREAPDRKELARESRFVALVAAFLGVLSFAYGARHNLLRAAGKILATGPRTLVIKHGEYGSTAFFSERSFAEKPGLTTVPFRAPALPLDSVVDPTGAGDSFAGGFFGYLASQPEVTPAVFKRAMFYGGVMGSFAVEKFGTERLQELSREEIDQRFSRFRELSHLD